MRTLKVEGAEVQHLLVRRLATVRENRSSYSYFGQRAFVTSLNGGRGQKPSEPMKPASG